MLSLRELQQQFAIGLDEKSELIFNYIQPNEQLQSGERLAIYQSSILGILQKTLKSIYPVCYALVGHEFFMAMVNRFIAVTPSLFPDLGHYGETFPEFLADFPPAKSLPYLSDVTKLEWAWHISLTAPDNPVFDFKKLAEYMEIKGGEIIFLLPYKATLLRSSYPLHKIWQVNQPTYTGDQTVVLEPDAQYLYLIWCNKLDIRIDILNQEEWQILTWFQEKIPFEKICEKISTSYPSIDIIELLPKLINQFQLRI